MHGAGAFCIYMTVSPTLLVVSRTADELKSGIVDSMVLW